MFFYNRERREEAVLPSILILLFISPSETKNQWARDDPAFVAILLVFLSVAAVSYAVAFRASSFAIVKIMFWAAFVEFLIGGTLIATIGW